MILTLSYEIMYVPMDMNSCKNKYATTAETAKMVQELLDDPIVEITVTGEEGFVKEVLNCVAYSGNGFSVS